MTTSASTTKVRRPDSARWVRENDSDGGISDFLSISLRPYLASVSVYLLVVLEGILSILFGSEINVRKLLVLPLQMVIGNFDIGNLLVSYIRLPGDANLTFDFCAGKRALISSSEVGTGIFFKYRDRFSLFRAC